MSGKFALIIGNTEYTDPGLAQLTAPGKDAEDFARVLKDQDLCAFDDVNVLLNQPSYVIGEVIDTFFYQKKPDDLLIVYFSGHGVRDEFGALYLAVKNTNRARLRATAIRSDYIREAMDQSRSKRQVVILDCCNSGAFPQGTKAETGGMMGMVSALQGYGRFVLTASDATQFAWEGDKIIGGMQNSLFTHFLVKGLQGEADRNGDGRITVDELYDYAFDEISRLTPKQTPTKSISKQEGEIVLRQINRIEDIKPLPLPDDLVSEIDDLRPYVREAAVQKLEKIIKGRNIGLARSALEALEKIAADENTTRRVAQMAAQVLESVRQTEQKAEEERRAKEEAERLAALKAEEERLAREKTEAEQKAKEEAEKLLRAQAEREAAEREAVQLKAEREAAEKAAHEAAQKAEREAMELASPRRAERESAEKAEREAIELAARRKEEREAKAKVAVKGSQPINRSWITVGIIGIVTVVLALCGYGITKLLPMLFVVATPTSPPATEAPVAEPPIVEVPATVAPTEKPTSEALLFDKPVTITWWHITTKDPGLSDWQKMADDYMAAHPNVTVEITVLENEAFKTKLTTVMQSGNPPDIFQSWGGGTFNQQVEAGLLKDITAGLNADAAWRDSFAPGALGVYSYQGKNYGVPWDMGMVGFWYNKALFEQAGIDAPPATWTEFLEDVQKLKDAGITPISIGEGDKWPGMHFWNYLATRLCGQAKFEAAMARTGSFTDPCFVEAGTKLQELVALEPFQEGFLGAVHDDMQATFGNGKAAMELSGQWAPSTSAANSADEQGVGENLGFFGFPAVEGGVGAGTDVVGGGNGFAIGKNAEPEAIDFVKYLTSVDNQTIIAANGSGIPVVKGAETGLTDPNMLQVQQTFAAADYFQLYYDQFLPPATGSVLNDSVQGLFAGTLTPEQVAQAIEDSAQQELK